MNAGTKRPQAKVEMILIVAILLAGGAAYLMARSLSFQATWHAGLATCAVILAMAVALLLARVSKPRIDLDALLARQALRFPTSAPGAVHDPDTAGPEWAPSMSGWEWLAANDVKVTDDGVDQEACKWAFATQLGPRWKGIDTLAREAKCVALVTALHATTRGKEALALRNDVAKAYAYEKGDRLSRNVDTLLAPFLADENLRKEVETVGNAHGFVSTAVVSMLSRARKRGGVLASCEFLWMKGIDRTLWYALNNLGRGCFHFEALGTMAHHAAEVKAGRALTIPHVETAVGGANDYVARFATS